MTSSSWSTTASGRGPGLSRVGPQRVGRVLARGGAAAARGPAATVEVVVVTVGDEEAEEALLELPRQGRRSRACGSGTTRWRAPMRWRSRVCWRPRSSARRRISCCAGCSPPTRSTARPESRWRAISTCRTSRSSSSSSYDAADGTATVERELEGGLVEVLRVRAPALLTIQTGINEPRYATLRAIKQAREKPLEVDRASMSSASTPAAVAGRRRLAAARAGSARSAARAPKCSTARRRRSRRGSSRSCGTGCLDERDPGGRRDASRRAARGLARAGRRSGVEVKDAAGRARCAVAVIDADAERFAAALAGRGGR